ncbi:MAG: folate family ECF transporter S component [Clostridia bacterium]|nr:folate family ECF transporter S component [Clostridia bacterium]
MSKIKQTILAGLLLATTIVLSRFLSIKTPIVVISFSFIPIMLSGMLLGPWWAMIICGLSDLIGALLFPFGAYFVGYTITSTLAGLTYGLFLQRKNNKTNKKLILNLIISSLIVLILCNGVLNSIWIYITAKKAIMAILPTRLLKQIIMLPIHVIVLYFLNLGLDKMGAYKKLFNEETDETEDENAENIKSETIEGKELDSIAGPKQDDTTIEEKEDNKQ